MKSGLVAIMAVMGLCVSLAVYDTHIEILVWYSLILCLSFLCLLLMYNMKLKDFHLSETIGEDNYRLQKSNECLLNSYYTLKKEYEVSYAKLKNSNLELKRLSEENLLLKQSLDRLKLNTSSTKDEDSSKEYNFEDLRKLAHLTHYFSDDVILSIWKSDVDSYNESIRKSTEMKPMRRVRTQKPI